MAMHFQPIGDVYVSMFPLFYNENKTVVLFSLAGGSKLASRKYN